MSINTNIFNESQKEALNAPIKNVIVSAGAGSGKSTVLVARLVKQIVVDKIHPSNFLVVTYTKEAAGNLKNLIKKELIEVGNLNHLLPYVDVCHIETIDAFRLFLVKKYSEVLKIKNNISIIEEDILKVETYKILDDVLSSYYETENPLFDELLANYLKKDDDTIKDFLYYIIKDIPCLDTEEYLKKYFDYALNNLTIKYAKKYIEEMKKIHEEMHGEKVYDIILEKCSKLFLADNIEEIIEGIKEYKSNSKQLRTTLKDEINVFKKNRDELLKLFDYDMDNFRKIDLPLQRRLVNVILEIARTVKERIDNFKNQKGFYTYKDVENFSNKLLEENQDICEELHHEFKVVMIDEYQDTSDASNQFLSKIAHNNLFAVGDIKQSIYGFNNANPEVFKNTLENFKNDVNSLYIPMNINYRSRKEVINQINKIFEGMMNIEFGGANYQDKENQLIYDKNYGYDKNDVPSYDKGLFYLSTDDKLTKDNLNNLEKYQDLIIDSENQEISKQAKINKQVSILNQVKMIANNIRNRLGKALVTGKTIRPCCYSDFAILTRTSSSFDIYRKVFSEYGIPINVLKEESITEDDCVVVLISIISFICLLRENSNNIIKIKYYFASIARSFLYEYHDQKIYDLFEKNNFYEDEIYLKILNISKNIEYMSLSDLYITIIKEFTFIEKLKKIGNVIRFLMKLELLHDKIKTMDKLGYTIFDLKYYLDMIKKLDLKIAVKLDSQSKNSVTLQTIHGSKGLQYRIVYFPDLGRKFRFSSNEISNSSYYVNKKLGFYFPIIARSNKNSKSIYLSRIGESMERKKIISEEMRLFYVALTRIKECGIIVLDKPLSREDYKNIEDCESYIDFLNHSEIKILKDNYGYSECDKEVKKTSNEEIKQLKIISKNITYKQIKYSRASMIPIIQNQSLLDIGEHFHLLMQCVDLLKPDLTFIKNDDDKQIIARILSNELFKNLENVTIHKEYEFIDQEKNVNGIIDLLMIFKDYIKIIDYKYQNIDKQEYYEQLQKYKSYIERVFNKPTRCYLLSLKNNVYQQIF